MDYILLNRDDLALDGTSREFEGYKYGDTGITFILVEMKPGRGPKLHQHPYEEVFIVLEGQATYTVGTGTVEVTAGQVVIVPKDTPHKFINSGTGILKQVDIHHNNKFITTWLED